MKCVAISDTHGLHGEVEVQVPDGDVLIHAGDSLRCGSLEELEGLNEWFGTLPHAHKILIAGNHDWCFENIPEEARALVTNAVYLQDEAVTLDGVKFYGAPWQPWFLDWAFNLQRGEEIREKWNLIPEDTDVLITHGPPAGILDHVPRDEHVGCQDLLDAVLRIKPQAHVFGHIHEGHGEEFVNGTHFINASTCTPRYLPWNPPVVFDL